MGIVLLPSVFLCDSVHKRVAKGGMASVTQKVFMYKHFSLQAIAGNCEVHKRGNKGSISLLHASHNAHRSTLPFCSVQVCSASGYLLCCSAFLQLVCAHLCSSSFSFNPNHQLTDISCFLSIFFLRFADSFLLIYMAERQSDRRQNQSVSLAGQGQTAVRSQELHRGSHVHSSSSPACLSGY